MKALRVAGKVVNTVGRYTFVGALMAVCLFFNSYLTSIASGLLSPSVLLPLRSGLALILSTVIAWCYKEKPSVKSVVGTIIAFGGLIVMNAPMIFGIPIIGL